MIFEWVLDVILGVITPILQLVSWQAPAIGDLSGFFLLGTEIGQANRYLPIDVFLVVVAAGLAFDLVMTGAHFLVFVYRLIPLKFT